MRKATWTSLLFSTSLIVASAVGSQEPTKPTVTLQQTIDYINCRLTQGDLEEHRGSLVLSPDNLILGFEYWSGRNGEELQITKSIPVLSIDVASISAQSSFVLPCKNESCVEVVWKHRGTSKTIEAEPSHELVIRSFLPDPYVRKNVVKAFTHLVDLVDQERKSQSEDKKDPFHP